MLTPQLCGSNKPIMSSQESQWNESTAWLLSSDRYCNSQCIDFSSFKLYLSFRPFPALLASCRMSSPESLHPLPSWPSLWWRSTVGSMARTKEDPSLHSQHLEQYLGHHRSTMNVGWSLNLGLQVIHTPDKSCFCGYSDLYFIEIHWK